MMRASESLESQTLKGIVRGERAWSELADIGITVRTTGDSIEIRNPRQLSVIVDAKDLSEGILRYKHDPVKVREWATMVMADAISCELRLKEEGEEKALLDVCGTCPSVEDFPPRASSWRSASRGAKPD